MAFEVPLDRVQRWMQAVVVHAGTPEDAVRSEAAQAEIPSSRLGEVVLPSKTLTPTDRVAIYHGMYPLRMVEALASDYPALQHFLGDDAFRELVRGYVQVHPSRHYSLNRLGDRFPDYVETAREMPRRRDFCHDLARLELAIAEVFDAPAVPALQPEAVAAVPPETWETARLRTVDAFRLLAFRYPVNAYLQSVRDDNHDHPKPRLKHTWVAVYRRDYSVYRLELTLPAHDLLADLVSGTPLGEAVAKATRTRARRRPSAAELFRWFRDWVAGGMFRAL